MSDKIWYDIITKVSDKYTLLNLELEGRIIALGSRFQLEKIKNVVRITAKGQQ